MLISFGLALTIAIIGGLAVCILLAFLLMKIRMPRKGATITGIIIGLLGGMSFIMFSGRAYIVNGIDDYEHYVTYGSPTYEFDSGETMKLAIPVQKTLIVNNSEVVLGIEEVVYSTYGFGGGWYESISPGEVFHLNAMGVDYFFDDVPPDEIETSSSGDVYKYWLYSLE